MKRRFGFCLAAGGTRRGAVTMRGVELRARDAAARVNHAAGVERAIVGVVT